MGARLPFVYWSAFWTTNQQMSCCSVIGHTMPLSVIPLGVVLVLVVDCSLLGLGFCTTLNQDL